jgi:hypothetical protein
VACLLLVQPGAAPDGPRQADDKAGSGNVARSVGGHKSARAV